MSFAMTSSFLVLLLGFFLDATFSVAFQIMSMSKKLTVCRRTAKYITATATRRSSNFQRPEYLFANSVEQAMTNNYKKTFEENITDQIT